MNEVHLTGRVKSTWAYSDNLYARLGVRRTLSRPQKNSDGGPFDYITVVFFGGARKGMSLQAGQPVTVHGFVQSRDVQQSLGDFLRRSQRQNADQPEIQADDQAMQQVALHRSITEVVAERWEIGPVQPNGNHQKR